MRRIFLVALLIFTTPLIYAENLNTIKWQKNLDQALEAAKKSNQLLILDFYADWCPPCNQMEKSTYSDSRVIEQLKNYIPVKIDIDKKPKPANKYDGNARANGGSGIPATIILDADGNQLAKVHGYQTPEELIELVKAAELKYKK
jgi:thioredoxin 1